MRTRTILRMIYHAPTATLAILLGCHGKPKPPRKDYATIILCMIVITVWGLALSYLLTPN
jgi:hypothetical protein